MKETGFITQSAASKNVELLLDTFLFQVALLLCWLQDERQEMSSTVVMFGLALKLYLIWCERAVILDQTQAL